jgi:hypothetical protein
VAKGKAGSSVAANQRSFFVGSDFTVVRTLKPNASVPDPVSVARL